MRAPWVERGLPRGQARGSNGDHDQPVVAAGQRGQSHKTRWKTTLSLTPMHTAKTTLMLRIANIGAALSHVRTIAEQLSATDRGKTLLNYIVARIIVARIIPRRPQKLLQTSALLAC